MKKYIVIVLAALVALLCAACDKEVHEVTEKTPDPIPVTVTSDTDVLIGAWLAVSSESESGNVQMLESGRYLSLVFEESAQGDMRTILANIDEYTVVSGADINSLCGAKVFLCDEPLFDDSLN